MKRKIITIDKELCNGCGICAAACHEGAIGLVDGKAELLSDHYCDGLGDCQPSCPTGAITVEERDADAYDEDAVKNQLRDMGIDEPDHGPESQLRQWPVQIQSIPIKTITVLRMEVPCCWGIEMAVTKAMAQSGKTIPWALPKPDLWNNQEIIGYPISTDGIRK